MLLAGCASWSDTSHLAALGVRARVSDRGWFQLRTADFSFEMPGVPLGEREQYFFGGVEIDALFFDLSTGQNWREYLFRAFDVRSLAESDRESVRGEAETQIVRAGRGSVPRPMRAHDGYPAHELIVEGMNSVDWSALVRTSVRGGWVFQQVVVFDVGDGDWSDIRYFLDSVRVESEIDPSSVPLEVDE
jgi:hypothetical protein